MSLEQDGAVAVGRIDVGLDRPALVDVDEAVELLTAVMPDLAREAPIARGAILVARDITLHRTLSPEVRAANFGGGHLREV